MSSRSSHFHFDPARLAQELLALGNPKITSAVAKQISLELSRELKTRPAPRLSAEVISGMVAFKLKELGVLQSSQTKEVPSSLSQRAKVQLPTLEKFLQETKVRSQEEAQVASQAPQEEPVNLEVAEANLSSEIEIAPQIPLPPHANLQVAPLGLQVWEAMLKGQGNPQEVEAHLRQSFMALAEKAAQAESVRNSREEAPSADILAVEFFNTLANQEFYPHVSELLGPQHWREMGTGFIWIDLFSLSHAAQEQALVDVKKLWQQGTRVGFILSHAQANAAFSPESLVLFVRELSLILQALPQDTELPHPVSFYLWSSHPETLDLLKVFQGSQLLVNAQVFLGWSSQFGEEELRQVKLLHDQVLQEKGLVEWLDAPYSQQYTLELPRPGGGPALAPYEACQIGSLNLSVCASGGEVDFTKLRRILRTALHFLDNLTEVNLTALEKITQRSLHSRKLSLGVMGWAEMLAKLGCPYDSPAALTLAKRVATFIHQESAHVSATLAQQKNVRLTFGLENAPRHRKLNGIIPSSLLAHLAGVTPGIYPLETLLTPQASSAKLAVRPVIQKLALERGLWSNQVEADLLRWNSLQPSPEAPSPLKRLLLTQHEISYEAIQSMTQVFQKSFDGAVWGAQTKVDWETIFASLKEEEQKVEEEVEEFSGSLAAFDESSKVMTEAPLEAIAQEVLAENENAIDALEVFEKVVATEEPPLELELNQEASAEISSEAPLETSASSESLQEDSFEDDLSVPTEEVQEEDLKANAEENKVIQFVAATARERPEILNSRTYQVATGYGPLRVNIGSDTMGPYEVTLQVDKAGSEASVQAETISRLATLLLSHNVSPKLIVEELSGIRSFMGMQNFTQETSSPVPLSLADGLAQVLRRELTFKEEFEENKSTILTNPQTPQNFFTDNEEEDFTVIESARETLEEVTEITERYEGELLH